ncbi:MAG: glutaminyl-peptide cyclotransferase [Longimicrobiales bacterium]
MRRRLALAPARVFLLTTLFVPASASAGCSRDQVAANGEAGETAIVVQRFPHDTSAYTQGLEYHDGALYESTGQLGHSTVRVVDLPTGAVQRQVELAPDRFGEGLTVVGDRIIQLTWTSGVGYVYDRATLALQDSFTYEGQGWGLDYDGETLIMSDGTSTLRFLDPATFEVLRTVEVRDDGAPLTDINELEWINGEVWANVYRTDYVVRIDPATGVVKSWIDLRDVFPASERPASADVLNGIAHDAATGRTFVTGKLWPTLFEIRLQ